MTTAAFLSFLVVAVVAVLTPGLDTMLVLRHSLLSGRRAGLATVAGISLGCLIWAVASLAGLTTLLTASRTAYDVVRLLGAAYLLWLGGSALWKSLPRNRKPTADPGADVDAAPAGRSGSLRAGLVSNLLNPKVGVFYMSLLPQFLPVGAGAATWGGLLVAVHLSITAVWLPSVVWLAGRARALFRRDGVRAWMERVTAGVLLGLGLKLALEQR